MQTRSLKVFCFFFVLMCESFSRHCEMSQPLNPAETKCAMGLYIVSSIRLRCTEMIRSELKISGALSPLLCCRLSVCCGIVHAALISFIPISLAALCLCSNFTILTLTDPEQYHTTRWGRVGTHKLRYTHTRTAFCSLPPSNTHPHRHIQTEHLDPRRFSLSWDWESFGVNSNSGWYRLFTPVYTSIHTNSQMHLRCTSSPSGWLNL